MFAALGKIAECSGKDHLPAAETGPGHPGRSQVAGIFRLRLRNASGVKGVRRLAFEGEASWLAAAKETERDAPLTSKGFQSISEKPIVFSKYFAQAFVGQGIVGVVVNPLHCPGSDQSVDNRLFRRFRGRGQQRVQLIVS